ncbi:MAG: UDP-glucose 4-epimerase, partial [Kineosporiaceae bacterium]|nr:UDP-glucose 4-epimerase [Aeromicrobium sp.]
AQGVINLFQSSARVEVIGTRHAEKLSEALASREELSRARDMGDYFRIEADKRDLNYSVYVEQGDVEQAQYQDYDSHTVDRMDVSEVEQLLLTLPEVRDELVAAGIVAERMI